MKKILTTIIMIMLLTPLAEAQMDTVQWKCNRYHYSIWYDTLPEFSDTFSSSYPALQLFWGADGDYRNYVKAIPQYVERPTQVYGIAVTQTPYSPWSITRNPWFLAEYAYLFQQVGDTVVLLDSVRWDTIQPKVMKIALNADTQRFGFELVKVYEALFKNPVLVDSVFFIASSNNSGYAHCGSAYYAYEYLPVEPVLVFKRGMMVHYPSWCPKPSWWRMMEWNPVTRHFIERNSRYNSPIFGYYFPIVDYVELIVTSADTSMGTAGPVAHVARNTTQTIYAVPKRGYRFSHWQEDGGVHATRSVYIVNDTTRYTAVFEASEAYRVGGVSNDEAMGYVTVGDSVYYEGDTAVLEAFAAPGMKFRHWSTGSRDNPLRLVVSGDTVLTAYFSALGQYRVEGASSDEGRGYVLGGGTYLEDDTAVLEAVPADARYLFGWWNEGVNENPYQVVVSSDTLLTAYFLLNPAYEGIEPSGREGEPFRLTPNPARGQAAVELREGAERGSVLQMHDAAGHEVLNEPLEAGTQRHVLDLRMLAQGAYFVTVKTPTYTSTRKLVVE